MKPEIGYDRITISSYISDLLEGVEWNLKHTELQDPYFEQLCIEKFALKTLLQKIGEHPDLEPEYVIEQFMQKAEICASEDSDQSSNYIFSESRDTAMSILDSLYYGFMEEENVEV